MVGNGGKAVVCKETGKAEVFDLFEARSLLGTVVKEDPRPYREQALAVLTRLATTLRQGDNADGGVLDLFRRIERNLIFLPSGTGLEPIPDGAEFIVPKGCTIEQAVNFHDYLHIYVDSDIWALLSETQRAAMLVHETIYWYMRDPGPKGNFVETNSIRSRRVVAILMSGGQLENPEKRVDDVGPTHMFCYTRAAGEADRPETVFDIYSNANKHLTFQFHGFYDRNVVTRSVIESKGELQLPPGHPVFADGWLDSPIDNDVWISVDWTPGDEEHSHVRVRDGDGNVSWETFVCQEQK